MNKPFTIYIGHGMTMVNIDGDFISYGAIRGMYKDADGQGLQVDASLSDQHDEIKAICSTISSSIFKLNDILTQKEM